jgi:hypothetical protein
MDFVAGVLGLYSYVMLPWRLGTHENPMSRKKLSSVTCAMLEVELGSHRRSPPRASKGG